MGTKVRVSIDGKQVEGYRLDPDDQYVAVSLPDPYNLVLATRDEIEELPD